MGSEILWPNNKKSATMISVNLDAEYFWLGLDKKAKDMPKTLSMGIYGMTHGLDRLLKVFDDYKIKASFFVPGKVAEKYPESIKTIASCGHEISCHGYEHENLSHYSYEEQYERLSKAVKLIEESCGQKPVGFRAPEGDLTMDTLRIVRDLGMVYSSDLHDDDRPYFMDLGEGKKILQLPIQWAISDFIYLAFNYRPAFPKGQGRISNYTSMLSNWKDEYLGYHRRGLLYVLQIDPQTMGSPGRIGVLEEFLDYVNELGDTFFAKGKEIYDFMNK